MLQSGAGAEPRELSYCEWIGFWVQLGVLGFLAVVGAFYGSAGAAPGDETCGLVLSLAAVALAFMRLKQRFDGDVLDWSGFLFVDDMANLVPAIVVFVILGLIGLVAATQVEEGGLHSGGVALFFVSALGVFFTIKRVFDNIDRQH